MIDGFRKLMLCVLVLASLGTATACAGWNGRILEGSTQAELTPRELHQRVGQARDIVLAEKHSTSAIQNAQAEALKGIVQESGARSDFVVGWEFLNITDEARIEKAYGDYLSGAASAEDVLKLSQGGLANRTYLPILEATRALGGDLIGVNLSRAEKAPVVDHGLTAADPALVPPGFELGSPDYFDRFVAAMGGHGDPRKLQNYFAAQCLVDDVAAYRLTGRSDALRFLVIGSFHSEYSMGVAARLRKRDPSGPTAVIQFVDASDYPESELARLVRDPKYGALADYVVFVNEPR